MSLVTVSLRSRVDEASTSIGGYKGGPKCTDGFARDGNPMFTGGEIKLKLVSISFSAFVTVPPCVYIPVFYLFKSPADSESFFFPPRPLLSKYHRWTRSDAVIPVRRNRTTTVRAIIRV